MAQTETIQQPFKYAGQVGIIDEGNNLYYMRARYYDANLGRFISEDPAGFIDGTNLYAYVGGNPIMLVDPSGLAASESSGRSSVGSFSVPNWAKNPIGFAVFGLTYSSSLGDGTLSGNGYYNSNSDAGGTPQDKKLTDGEIGKLINGGVHPHDLKDNSKQDLFKDGNGNIIVKPKSGIGPGDPAGININDF